MKAQKKNEEIKKNDNARKVGKKKGRRETNLASDKGIVLRLLMFYVRDKDLQYFYSISKVMAER